MASEKSEGWGGCLVIIAILVIGYMAREQLARFGINSVNISYGVSAGRSLFGAQKLVGVIIQNTETGSKPHSHTEAELEIEVVHSNGDIEKKHFTIGEIKQGEKWNKEFDAPVTNVSAVRFAYKCKEGAAYGVFDMEKDFNSSRNSESEIN